MRIGLRVLKTALAVMLALAVSRLLGLKHPVFAGVAAIICMQPTVAGSVRSGIQRMQATIIGAAFSLLALVLMEALPFLLMVRPVLVGLTVLAVMVVTLRLGWLDSLVLAAATVVVIMVLPAEENIYYYSLSRTVLTFVGIVVATGVNALLVTPRYSGPLWREMRQLIEATDHSYRQAVEGFCFRNIGLAKEAGDSLSSTDRLAKSTATRVQWMEEEAQLRKAMHRRPEAESEVLARAFQLIGSLRQSTATIISVTTEVLQRAPQYAEHQARVYEILWDLAQLGFRILDHIRARLAGQDFGEESPRPAWTDELHRQLIQRAREAHRAPRDIFPLVEVSVVAFEIRRVTELLVSLEDAIAKAPRAGS